MLKIFLVDDPKAISVPDLIDKVHCTLLKVKSLKLFEAVHLVGIERTNKKEYCKKDNAFVA